MSRTRVSHAYSPLCDGDAPSPSLCLGRCDHCGARMYAGEHPVAVQGTHDRVHLHCLPAYLEENAARCAVPLHEEAEV